MFVISVDNIWNPFLPIPNLYGAVITAEEKSTWMAEEAAHLHETYLLSLGAKERPLTADSWASEIFLTFVMLALKYFMIPSWSPESNICPFVDHAMARIGC